ncbi:MAG: lytic transglycosylase domain-containing protein [Chlamydiae bacterium]|nr:lytic transglycosylase domain-containing protein [Chlamydiota bacterium]MBI3277448.1 lytic transglycosylase domain-containing protein [Chlamydiota bacterium]
MKTYIRLLIILMVIYVLGFPLVFGLIKARKHLFPVSYRSLICQVAREYHLDPLWVAALIYAESGFRANAVSKSGAMGLMQLMPETARDLAHEKKLKEFKVENLMDSKTNVQLGCLYLEKLKGEFKDLEKVLVAYNAGRINVLRWQEGEDMLSKAYPETRKYVTKIHRVFWILKFLDGIYKFE